MITSPSYREQVMNKMIQSAQWLKSFISSDSEGVSERIRKNITVMQAYLRDNRKQDALNFEAMGANVEDNNEKVISVVYAFAREFISAKNDEQYKQFLSEQFEAFKARLSPKLRDACHTIYTTIITFYHEHTTIMQAVLFAMTCHSIVGVSPSLYTASRSVVMLMFYLNPIEDTLERFFTACVVVREGTTHYGSQAKDKASEGYAYCASTLHYYKEKCKNKLGWGASANADSQPEMEASASAKSSNRK